MHDVLSEVFALMNIKPGDLFCYHDKSGVLLIVQEPSGSLRVVSLTEKYYLAISDGILEAAKTGRLIFLGNIKNIFLEAVKEVLL